MFRGLTAVSLDVKGRVSIPGRYRHAIAEAGPETELVVTIDPTDRCLWLYAAPEWQLIEAKLSALPSFSPAARRIQRLLIGHATDVEMDSAGRILLPPLLREYAGLEKNMMIVGQGNKCEIWDEIQWRTAREGWLNEALDSDGDIPAELQSISL